MRVRLLAAICRCSPGRRVRSLSCSKISIDGTYKNIYPSKSLQQWPEQCFNGFDSQCPNGSSQLSVTVLSGDPMPSFRLQRFCMHILHRYMDRQNLLKIFKIIIFTILYIDYLNIQKRNCLTPWLVHSRTPYACLVRHNVLWCED